MTLTIWTPSPAPPPPPPPAHTNIWNVELQLPAELHTFTYFMFGIAEELQKITHVVISPYLSIVHDLNYVFSFCLKVKKAIPERERERERERES